MHANLPTTELLLPAPFCAKPDIVRRFLAWVQTADADARAQGVSALAPSARASASADCAQARNRRTMSMSGLAIEGGSIGWLAFMFASLAGHGGGH